MRLIYGRLGGQEVEKWRFVQSNDWTMQIKVVEWKKYEQRNFLTENFKLLRRRGLWRVERRAKFYMRGWKTTDFLVVNYARFCSTGYRTKKFFAWKGRKLREKLYWKKYNYAGNGRKLLNLLYWRVESYASYCVERWKTTYDITLRGGKLDGFGSKSNELFTVFILLQASTSTLSFLTITKPSSFICEAQKLIFCRPIFLVLAQHVRKMQFPPSCLHECFSFHQWLMNLKFARFSVKVLAGNFHIKRCLCSTASSSSEFFSIIKFYWDSIDSKQFKGKIFALQ